MRSQVGGLALAFSANVALVLLLLGIQAEGRRAERSAPVKAFDVQEPPQQQEPPPPAPAPKLVAPPRERFLTPRPVVQVPVVPTIEAAPPAPQPLPPAPQLPVQTAGGEAPAPPARTHAPQGPAVYAARDWVRKPTTQQLDRYRPSGSPAGWAVVSCRTAPKQRVTDCAEVSSFPEGSGLAAALRRASWQFRIMPPRRDGQELIGVPIHIRVEYVSPRR